MFTHINHFLPSLCVCRIDQVSTLYQNISLTDTRMIPQYEKVLLNFSSEIKLQSKEMERLALAVKRYAHIKMSPPLDNQLKPDISAVWW